MEKKTSDLCVEVLRRFHKAGVLKYIILIGSWSIRFYKDYFKSPAYSTYIRTRDIDFLVPIPFKFKNKLDIFKLVEDLGFLEEFKGSKGYIKLEHPDLTIEFLVPEKGKGSNTPYPLPQLGINAQPLRYLGFLADNTITINSHGLDIRLPHPAAYTLHKFIVFKRRRGRDKHDKDIEGALRVFQELLSHKAEHSVIKHIFSKMHKKWQKTVIDNLRSVEELEIIDFLTST